jgi:malonyl-CoA/methylmalonyl-CoA synthetase
VARHDVVLLSAPTSIGLVVSYLATVRLGAAVVFASPAAPAADVAHLVADSGARAAIVADGAPGPLPGGVAQWAVADVADAAEPGDAVADGAARPDDVAVLAYTSGTTGVPKGVPLTHANLLASVRGATAAWGWRADDVLVHALPLTHQHGLSGVHAALVHGSSTAVRSRFAPEDLMAELVAVRATVLFAVPTIYERLLEWGGLAETDLSSLRLVVSGSAPMSPALFARVEAAFGQPPLERYGTTETGLDVSNPYRGDRRPGSVGLPLPGVELEIVDGDQRALPPGTTGEIRLRGPQVASCYWGRPDDTASAFLDGGWFRTGDLAYVDPADGYVVITGRSKELIISGGLNVYPREVELALEEHPSVRRAAVLGRQSPRWGEEVWALVVVDEGFVPDDLQAHVRERLAGYKRPKGVVVVEDLPVTAVGKIARSALAALLARELEEESLVPEADR